ncbi:MAG: efflux RND transporter periplasmic adaptor subunit [Bacteroidetes bacterium]|nr:efflux RND transporter periplasmic adaptor subunit [Bacteroidota bacterium]
MKKLIFIIGILLIATACKTGSDNKTKLEQLKKQREKLTEQINQLENTLQTSDEKPATPVNTEILKKQTFFHYIEVQGKIDGNENIAISPRSSGVVLRIVVKEGDHVRKGQLLAELDAEVLKQALKELQSSLAYVTDLYNKQKALWDQKIGSEVQYLTAKNQMESLQNKIATTEDQIKMSNITSPIDGTVEEIPIKVGQMASPSSPQPAFRIINFSKAKVVAEVGEAYSAKINTGDQVKIFLPDFNKELEERVTFASKYINPTNRTFTVEAELNSGINEYRANMIAVVRIKDYSNPSVIAIPQNYIQSSRDEGQYVFAASADNGKKAAHKKFIKAGSTYNGLTEILSGLNDGDRIITAGYKDLYDGQFIDYK